MVDYDNSPLAASHYPALSAVDDRSVDVGVHVAEAILARHNEPDRSPTQALLPPPRSGAPPRLGAPTLRTGPAVESGCLDHEDRQVSLQDHRLRDAAHHGLAHGGTTPGPDDQQVGIDAVHQLEECGRPVR